MSYSKRSLVRYMTKRTHSFHNRGFLPIVLILGVLVIGVSAIIAHQLGLLTVNVEMPKTGNASKTIALIPSPTPTPTSLKQGKEIYIYSWGQGTTVPKLSSIEIDPHDPKVGETQHVTVKYTHPTAIQSVSMQLFSDNKSTTFPMTLSSGSTTDGTWTGSWTIEDSVLYRYDLRVLVKSDQGETPYDVILRGSKP